MKGKILVTDSLFIFDEHVNKLEAAGFEVERLDKPEVTERELIEAIKGKVGYILGGIEVLTQPVINAANSLKVITYTGIGYKGKIPMWKDLSAKGIAITNTPDSVTQAVAEWSLAATLAMTRGLFEISRIGDKRFLTTKGIQNQTVGIIGMGRIGQRIAEVIAPFRPKEIIYSSYNRHEEAEQKLGITYHTDKADVLHTADITFVCVSVDAGKDYLSASELKQMKDGALLVSFAYHGIINEKALLTELQSGRIRAAFDEPISEPEFEKLPLNMWYDQKGSNAFNTFAQLKNCSDTATQSVINVLTTGKDKYKVN